MLLLCLGLLCLLSLHLVPAMPNLRAGLVTRFGELPYKALFSLGALAGLALMIIGYRHALTVQLWPVPASWRQLPLVTMPVAFVLAIAAYLPGYIRAVLRNPMLLGVVIWSVSHLLVTGDLASLLLFGSLCVYSVFAMRAASGRMVGLRLPQPNALMDAAAIVLGVGLYAAALFLHGKIGPPVI